MAYESILVGSGEIWIAPEGEAFPLTNAAPAGNWVSLGDIDGGVTINQPQTVDMHRVDDESGPVAASRSEEDLQVVANLAEVTLAHLAQALHGDITDVDTDAGPPATTDMPLYRGVGKVPVRAYLFRGASPYAADVVAQFEIPRAVHTGNVGMAFVKDSKTLIPVEFSALVDPSASPSDERFGRWMAQTA